ncbi:MAG: EF-hand domain-containing protein [Candidatus Omnitrophica bacterium]|nr:EF-hand domain-containing protein [Candidatus Omnitrophota bacterium]
MPPRIFPAMGFLIIGLCVPPLAEACTVFAGIQGGRVLFGNNEDWLDCNARVQFLPAENGKHGVVYVGFRIGGPQGGMNDQGLCFDFAEVPTQELPPPNGKPVFVGNLLHKILRECGTVAEALAVHEQHHWPLLARCQALLCDRTGAAVILSARPPIHREGVSLIIPNPRLDPMGLGEGTPAFERFRLADERLELPEAGSPDGVAKILAAVHQETLPTQYSCVYDPAAREMLLYHFHDFTAARSFKLEEELTKGERTFAMNELFPKSIASTVYAERHAALLAAQTDERARAASVKVAEMLMTLSDRDGDSKLREEELYEFVCFDPRDRSELLERFDSDGDRHMTLSELAEALRAWLPVSKLVE